ncbi:LuxR C-terminal-related transcriptional regulator [Treponema succinifaciens]|uniref:LuxR C-terminal-related transcriptional regulator n=1 Tax=Treponema succinifaciens TaxID=167 RepID=UPI003FCE1AA2
MDFDEKKLWEILGRIGATITAFCLIVSLFQFFTDDSQNLDDIRKFIRIAINIIAFLLFLRLCFDSLDFRCYSVLFYCYGIGNFFDNGNILGILCLGLSFLFLNFSNFFKSYRSIKTCVFMILPVVSLTMQFFRSGSLVFLLSLAHIAGAVYMGFVAFAVLYPILKKAESVKRIKILEDTECSPRDIEFLSSVLEGKKYSKIAFLHDVSESTVKARMVELYKMLDVKNRTEFLTMYNGFSFKLNSSGNFNSGVFQTHQNAN